MRIINGNVSLLVKDLYHSELTTKGGLKLAVNNIYDKEKHARTTGIITGVTESKTIKTFKGEVVDVAVKVGDEVLFSFDAIDMAVSNRFGCVVNQTELGAEIIIPYSTLFAKIVDGEVVMLNNLVTVIPFSYDKLVEHSLIKDSSLIPEGLKKSSRSFGVVKYVPDNRVFNRNGINYEIHIEPGDIVCISKNSDIPLQYGLYETTEFMWKVNLLDLLLILKKN